MEPAAKAQLTAAVAAKLTTIAAEIMEQHRFSEEAERVLSMATLTATVLEKLEEDLAQHD